MTSYHRLLFCLAFVFAMPLSTQAHAGATQVKTQAPGYYRMMLGDFEVTALSDGTLALPAGKLLGNTTPSKVEKALKYSYLKDPVETSVNGYLINTGSKLVLIDTGAGTLLGSTFGPALGNLIANLKASGYQPEQIDEIYITHMHPDHVGGLLIGDKLAFPNATVRADQREADFWLNQNHMDAATKEAKNSYQGAMTSLTPYVAAGKFKPFDGDTELIPGIRAVASYGHTVGHTTYVVESKGQKLALWGDLMHVAAVQFADPSVVMKFDTDSRLASIERKKTFADAAKQGYWVAGAHLAFPGIGHLRANARGYTWIPVNYSTLHSEAIIMKTTLITGANRGIGLEFCRQYAAEGWRVLACSRRPEKSDALNKLAAQYPELIKIQALDVADHAQIERLGQVLASESIDLLINNAGIYPASDTGDFGHTNYAEWMQAFQINAMAPLKMAETFTTQIACSKQKTIVTISSKMGSIEDNCSGGNYLYRSSKAAVNMVVKSLALDLKPTGITAVVFNPGWVKTDMGGPNAMISTEQSVSGMRQVISGLRLADTGKFFGYDGREIPW